MDWIPALSSTGLLALSLLIGRKFILTHIVKSVEHKFNTKLEILRTQLRESEEQFKADLIAKEAEIEALRSGAITALASRQIALDKRRLEAVDELWSAVMALAPARMISNMMSVFRFEETAERSERDPKVRAMFETLGSSFDPSKLNQTNAQKAQPFVSPMAWATFSAMQVIAIQATMRFHVIKTGMGPIDFMDSEAIKKLVKAALPYKADFIDKFGPAGYHFLLDELEAKLLHEFNIMLTGATADKASVEQAAEILKLSNEAAAEQSSNKFTT